MIDSNIFVTFFSISTVLAFLQAPSSQAATESVGGGVWNVGCDIEVWADSDCSGATIASLPQQ